MRPLGHRHRLRLLQPVFPLWRVKRSPFERPKNLRLVAPFPVSPSGFSLSVCLSTFAHLIVSLDSGLIPMEASEEAHLSRDLFLNCAINRVTPTVGRTKSTVSSAVCK